MANMYEILKRKKAGLPLSDEEISHFIKGYTAGDIPDYQASALLMAICLRGMNDREAAVLTGEMMRSGDIIDLSHFGHGTVDKHSTGGIGDKTSLIALPIVAALGATVAKMSGRGLGHTGGTVDKLESIRGYRTVLSPEEFAETVKKTGLCLVGQSGELAPADKKLYALRDVTATVDSIPLIASSIMSKKLASGAESIVLDVKVGSGAFMKTREEAEQLATLMVKIGNEHGRRVIAVLSDMDAPLGSAVGNALEVEEAVAVLTGKVGGALRTLSVTLAGAMAECALGLSSEEATARAEEALATGAAFRKMQEWIAAQGGDISLLTDTSLLPHAEASLPLLADRDGYLTEIDAEAVGRAAVLLGAGRERKDDKIDFTAGVLFSRSVGDAVRRGETIATLFTSERPQALPEAEALLKAAVVIGERRPRQREVVLKIIR